MKSTNEEYCQIPFNAINFSIIKKWTLYLTGSINSRILDPFIRTQRLVCCYILHKMKQINKSYRYFYHRGLLPLKKYMILVHIICTMIIFFLVRASPCAIIILNMITLKSCYSKEEMLQCKLILMQISWVDILDNYDLLLHTGSWNVRNQ